MHERFQLRVAAGIARGADLIEEADRRQLGIGRQAGFDDRLVGIELGRPRRPRPIAHRLVVEIALEIARPDPPVNRVATDAQLARQRTLAPALLQIVPE
jgi:hypothetical protein